MVPNNATGEVDQDRGKGGEPFALYHLPIGRSGGTQGSIRCDSVPDSEVTFGAQTRLRVLSEIKRAHIRSSTPEVRPDA